jgi:hypothetical protein
MSAHMGLMSSTRRAFMTSLGFSGLAGCRTPAVGGDPAVLEALSVESGRRGLGIGLLGGGALYVRYLKPSVGRIDIRIPFSVTLGKPAILTAWGQALLVLDGPGFRLVDLTGKPLGEGNLGLDPDGCVFDSVAKLLLVWGLNPATAEYSCDLLELGQQRRKRVYGFPVASPSQRPRVSASFVGRSVMVSVDHEDYIVAQGERPLRVPWSIEALAISPDGRRAAGRGRDDSLALVDVQSGAATRVASRPIGGVKWDPSSRYVMFASRTGLPFWAAQSELVVLDTFSGKAVTYPATAPDGRDHPYEWVLIPQG